jgi:Cellulase (glycosyl hydrolase family 5)
MFRKLAAAGGKSVRWWMHCEGRATPNYDAQGKPTGMPEAALANLGRMLDLAAANKVLVMPVLWSFDMAKNNRANLITDTALTRAYITNVLDPMVRRYKGHPGLVAWEICNEPEWMLDDDGSTTQRVTKLQLQRFHGLLAAAIHKADPSALVTTGSAAFKWCSTSPESKGNYYSDQALQAAAGGDPLAHLDFYQIHYYPWMRGQGWTYSPWDHGREYWGLDKPIVIGELPAKGEAGYLDAMQMHVGSVDSGYAGIMSWAFLDNRADKEGAFADAKPGIEAVAAKIPQAVQVPTSGIRLDALKPRAKSQLRSPHRISLRSKSSAPVDLAGRKHREKGPNPSRARP